MTDERSCRASRRAPRPLWGLAACGLALLAQPLPARAGPNVRPEVVYGADNRLEVSALAGAKAANADATVALVQASQIVAAGKGMSRLVSDSLGVAYNLCPGQRFRSQPTAAFCSGFLARPDEVVTAGHCVSWANLKSTRFVFGYRVLASGQARTTIADREIYRGVRIVTRRAEPTRDFAVVRLDRKVVGHAPAEIQGASSLALQTPLYVIGHPSGLPAKFAAGAKVLGNGSPFYFSANLDTFGGNSGSPVFHAGTHKVVGILVRGAPDYRPKGGCYVANILPDGKGEEESTRISLVRPYLGMP